MDFSSPNSLSNNNNFDGIGITNTANYHSSSSASQPAAQPQNHHANYSPHPHHQLPHQIPANSDQLSTFPGFGQFPEIPQVRLNIPIIIHNHKHAQFFRILLHSPPMSSPQILGLLSVPFAHPEVHNTKKQKAATH
jgi:hypothetical protein